MRRQTMHATFFFTNSNHIVLDIRPTLLTQSTATTSPFLRNIPKVLSEHGQTAQHDSSYLSPVRASVLAIFYYQINSPSFKVFPLTHLSIHI